MTKPSQILTDTPQGVNNTNRLTGSNTTTTNPPIHTLPTTRTTEERISNLETLYKHLITVIREKQSIGLYECAQTNTLDTIKNDMEKGDKKIQEGFTQLKSQIQELRTDLDLKKLSNGNTLHEIDEIQSDKKDIYTQIVAMKTNQLGMIADINTIKGSQNITNWFVRIVTLLFVIVVVVNLFTGKFI